MFKKSQEQKRIYGGMQEGKHIECFPGYVERCCKKHNIDIKISLKMSAIPTGAGFSSWVNDNCLGTVVKEYITIGETPYTVCYLTDIRDATLIGCVWGDGNVGENKLWVKWKDDRKWLNGRV